MKNTLHWKSEKNLYNKILYNVEIPETRDDVVWHEIVGQSLAQVQRLMLQRQLDKLNPAVQYIYKYSKRKYEGNLMSFI